MYISQGLAGILGAYVRGGTAVYDEVVRPFKLSISLPR